MADLLEFVWIPPICWAMVGDLHTASSRGSFEPAMLLCQCELLSLCTTMLSTSRAERRREICPCTLGYWLFLAAAAFHTLSLMNPGHGCPPSSLDVLAISFPRDARTAAVCLRASALRKLSLKAMFRLHLPSIFHNTHST